MFTEIFQNLPTGFLLSSIAHIVNVLPVAGGHYAGPNFAILFETTVIEWCERSTKWVTLNAVGKGFQGKIGDGRAVEVSSRLHLGCVLADIFGLVVCKAVHQHRCAEVAAALLAC